MHRSNGIVILPDNAIQTSGALSHVTVKASNEANIRIDIEINFHIKQVANLSIPKRKDSFHDDRLTRSYQDGFSRAAALTKIINRNGDLIALFEALEMVLQKRPIESLRMIEVVLAVDFQMLWRRRKIVGVLVNQDDRGVTHAVNDFVSKSGLTGS